MVEQGSFEISDHLILGPNVARRILPQKALGINFELFQGAKIVSFGISPREGTSLQAPEKKDPTLENNPLLWVDKDELLFKSPVNGAPTNSIPFAGVFRVLRDGSFKTYCFDSLFSGKPEQWSVETHLKEIEE